jgi:acyl-CoA reductase-like NAD-dependent aldehyde dehydrogenase
MTWIEVACVSGPPFSTTEEVDIGNSLADATKASQPRAELASSVDARQAATRCAPEVVITGEPVATVFPTAPSRVPAIVARAQVAACAWGDLAFRQRAEALVRLRELVAQRAREIAEVIAHDMGKPLIEARLFEVARVIDALDECIAHATDALADEPIAALVTLPALLGRYRAALLPRTPRAVVCVIARISSPFDLAMTPAVIALTAGNAVIVKSSSSAPLVGVVIERLFDDAFTGFPGLVQVVHGARAIGAALMTTEGVDAVLFTGSTLLRMGRTLK